MRNLSIYLFSALLMSATVVNNNQKDQAISYRILRYAIRLDCEHYRVFYEEDEKWSSVKGKLFDLVRKGFDANDIIVLSEGSWDPNKYSKDFNTNYRIDLRKDFALVKDRDGNVYEVRYNELETFFRTDNM